MKANARAGTRLHCVTVLQRPSFEDYGREYVSANIFSRLADEFYAQVRDRDDLT